MTTFSSAIRLCGLSRREAADYFGVRLDTVGSWSSGSNPVPPGVWDMLADLWRRIEDAADSASLDPAVNDPRALHNLEADDADGLPGGAAEAAGAMALLVALAYGNEGSDDPA
jgi:hypothetical protein